MKKILLILFTIILVIGIYHYYTLYEQGKKSLEYSFTNNIHCGSPNCLPSISDLSIPVQNGKEYNKDVARYCAELVLRLEISANDGTKLVLPKDQKLEKNLINLTEAPLFGIVLSHNDTAWVVFRGTLHVQEWVQDFKYNQTELPVKQEQKNVQRSLILRGVQNQPQIHQGFLDVYNNFRNDLYDALKSINPSQVIITGHSLGAGVATIAGVDIVNDGYPNTVVYNFASPRVGDGMLEELVKDKLPLYRFVNNTDIVPTIPTSVCPNFSDAEKPYFYKHCGKALYMSQNWKSLVNNHLMGVYIDGLDKDQFKQECDTNKND